MANVAQMIFRGGNIITMNDERRTAQAVAIGDGRILAVGDDIDVMTLRTPATNVVDLRGMTLMPSFIDAHGHFMNALQIVRWANCSVPPVGPVTSIARLVDVLETHAKKTALEPGEWLIGYGYDAAGLSDGRDLTCDDLDTAFADNPVMVLHNSNHGAVLNTRALKEVGITADTPTPPGGIIVREPGSNEPTGLVMETAFMPVFAHMPQPSEQQMLDTFDAAQQLYARAGTTTAQEGATHAGDLALLTKAASQGRLYLDIVSLPFVVEVPKLVDQCCPKLHRGHGPLHLPDTASLVFGRYENRLKLQGVKVILDGSPQGKTAYWSKPILTPGPNGEEHWRGQPTFPAEIVNPAIEELVAKGIQIFSHCNGDAAIDMYMNALQAAGVSAKDDRRDVVIHSQFMRPEQLDRYVELGLSPSFFTVHVFFWGTTHVKNLGIERAHFMSPMASALKRGLVCSNHNDFSITPIEPMRMVWTAVERRSREGEILGPNERVSRWDALKALTTSAAWQIREDDHKGTIEVGKLADLVILDGDPLTVHADEIVDITVLATFKEGKVIYKQPLPGVHPERVPSPRRERSASRPEPRR